MIHQHFCIPARGGALRSYYLARALADRGIQTVVITAHNERIRRQEIVDGIEVHYLPVAYENKFGFTARSFSFLSFAWKSIRVAAGIQQVDWCYAISVPLTVGLAAIWLKKRKGIPFLFEVGDLWPDAPIQMGFVQNYFLRAFLYNLEKRIYQEAFAIVALSVPIQDAIAKKISGKAIHLVPNMADTQFFQPAGKDSNLEKKFGTTDKLVISYLGAVGAANGLDYFIECANVCRKANLPIKFILCGAGALLDRLKRNAEHLGLRNLTFVDFQNRDGIRTLMDLSDAVFVCYKNVPILETGSPNKFFDGLAAGKLIVINFGGWIRKEVEENSCGVYVDPKNPEDFIAKIQPFMNDRKRLSQYQTKARQLAETQYSRELLSEKFVRLFGKNS